MTELLIFAVAGFVAQLIDGALGMAYGVTATTLLLSFGVPPAVASATVHTAEVFSSGFAGLAHYKFGNVVPRLVRRLMIPGILGAIIGAYLVTSFPAERIKPFIAAYLLLMGVVILLKAWKRRAHHEPAKHVGALGFAGGFFDTVGGGGWGPIVVGTLLARGNEPRETIGSANLAEFFVTLAATLTFAVTIGITRWYAIGGLAIGGAIAAPIAARIAGRVPTRPLLIAVGLTVIVLSVRTIAMSL